MVDICKVYRLQMDVHSCRHPGVTNARHLGFGGTCSKNSNFPKLMIIYASSHHTKGVKRSSAAATAPRNKGSHCPDQPAVYTVIAVVPSRAAAGCCTQEGGTGTIGTISYFFEFFQGESPLPKKSERKDAHKIIGLEL